MRFQPLWALLGFFACLGAPSPLTAQPKALPPHLVAPTDALEPAEERKAFTLPPGFEAQLVASEPQIQKPMQLAFDAKGRLWVTTSYHYPFAAPEGKGTDKLFVLSDFDPITGKAGKVRVFADDLNIPIGVLPLPDCKSVIVSSVGEIRRYTDTDGDLKADKSEVLFKGFGTRDTHGMTNSFTLMPDGWVYACHGFANDSTTQGKDGHQVKMQSGHTFRFRPDGSRIEVYSYGQVNPFGMTIDPWFNLYTADCHSKPITQIIPGAYYQSFGKPHDGLGFAGHVTKHDHGSTGLCGLAWYDADQFPQDFQGCMFVGNVVTNRINFDKIEWQGATPIAKELPDFLVSSDRWFRPVDIKLGPDGALYVADFYNKIIGHYEVDLKHPGRDKERGRIWRIVWKGKDGSAPAPKFHRPDFTKAEDADLLHDLFHANLTVRFLAGHQLRQRVIEKNAQPSIEPIVQKLINDKEKTASVIGWVLYLGEAGKQPADLMGYTNIVNGAKNSDNGFLPEHLTGHMVRALSSRADWGEDERKILHDVIKSFTSVHQRRACIEAIILHPHQDFAQAIIEVLKDCPEYDTHLRHAARIALRNCLKNSDAWPKNYDAIYADMAMAITSPKAVAYLASQIGAKELPQERLPAVAEYVGRHGSPSERAGVFTTAATLTAENAKPEDTIRGLEILRNLLRGIQAGGKQLQPNGGRMAEGRELNKFEELAARDLQSKARTPALARILAELYAALPAVCSDTDRPTGFALARVVQLGLIKNLEAGDEARGVAVEALGRFNLPMTAGAVVALFNDAKTSAALRERALVALASMTEPEARTTVATALKDMPYRAVLAVGAALAARPNGGRELLQLVRDGKAPPRLLQEKAILERLRAGNLPDLEKQIAALTKGLPPLDARLAELIKKRAAAFVAFKADRELGAKLFTKHCAACHRIGEMGGKIAPQLDGIGLRGLERLLEDTLDPNRNVDQAFRARVITTKDEKTITGLMLRVEGEVLILADNEGKEIRIPTNNVELNRETMLSPMPANFAEVIPEGEFLHLIAYLLDQKQSIAKKE